MIGKMIQIGDVFCLNPIFVGADSIRRYVFQRVFVADGNFKADHVRAKTPSKDIWLSEGGGMAPRRDEYSSFLIGAMDTNTVWIFPCGVPGVILMADPAFRTQRVKTPSEQ